MSNIPPQTLNEIVNVLNPQQQQHIFNTFMNNNNNVNRNMQMGMNTAVVGNSMPNNMNNMPNNQLFNTFRALQQPMNQNNMMNGQTTLNNTQAMNMNVQNNNNSNIPMQNTLNNNDTSTYLLQFLQQQLTTSNNNTLRNAGKQVMPSNTNQIVQPNNGMIGNESQMMGGFSNGIDNNMMSINNMTNIANMANMGMSNVNTMNNMNQSNLGNPTTPMSQMTGAVPNTINISQQQRSGTPLSNNSGGVLSSNTNTTTNTQSGLSANGMRRFSVEQIKLVQQLIEQCLKLYLSKEETMDFLCKKYENIERAFINLMWCKLEQQNPEFFKAYNTRLLIKDQISQFNQLVKEQANLMQQQGLLIQNNATHMPSTPTNGGMIGVQQSMGGMPNIGIMSGNIQSPYNSASSPITNQNTFGMIPNQPNVGAIQGNNGMNQNANNGAFVYPGVNGAGNFGINLQNAAVLGINNFQQGNNGMINPQNMNNTSAALNFAQQQNLYRQQQSTNPQPNFNNNTLSPQKQQMNLGLGNTETINESNPSNLANMFNTNSSNGGADISQMITHLLSSPAPVSTTTPQAKQTIQNFLKSPLVKVGRDVEERLRSLLNDGEPQNTAPNNSNVNTTDMNRQTSNGTPVTNNSTPGTSTPTIGIDSSANQNSSSTNNTQPSETPTIENVFEFPEDRPDVFGVNEFDDDFFNHNHDE